MTREEALARAEELNAAGEGGRRWMVQEAGEGDWRVVQVNVPGLSERGVLKETIEARPKPPTADDPRPSSAQQVPPFGGAA